MTGTAPALRALPTEPPLIYLVAPAGNPNYGDEFIVRAWLRHLARMQPDTEVVVDCHTPGQASVLLNRWHPRVSFVDTIWRICFDTAELPAAEAAEATAMVLAEPGRLPRIASGIDLLARAHTVHLVGGGYINTIWPHHLSLLAAAAGAARRFGARAVATGQGLVPAGDDDQVALLRALAADFTVFDVRDRASVEVLGADGRYSFTGDDSWLDARGPEVYDLDSPAAAREVMLCLQADLMESFADGQGTAGLAQAVGQLIDAWGLRGEQMAFLECIPGPDRIVYDLLAERVPEAMFVPFVDLWNRGLPARAGQRWISTRFHPHLLAAAAGASGLALSGPDDYYATKHRSLTDAGSRWQVVDADTLPDTAPTDGGFPADRVDMLVRQKTALAERLYPSSLSALRRTTRALRSRRR